MSLPSNSTQLNSFNTLIAGAKETLLRLEAFAKKHQLVGSEAPSKFRRGFNKLRYVSDASTINSLRSKVLVLRHRVKILC